MDARKTLADPVRQGSPKEDIRSGRDRLNLSAEQVYHDYAPRVYSVARRMVASDTDAEDVTQDVLLQVIRKLPSFRGESAFPTWLHRVTVNAALSHRRRQAVRDERRHSLDVQGEEAVATATHSPSPDDLLADHETQQLIDRAIGSLPDAYRVVFLLSDVEGLPNAVIAERLGMSLPAVKSRLHRARALLRDALSPHLSQ
jgi:RNA polymerase sigma-70 factor (ECF subfamily)